MKDIVYVPGVWDLLHIGHIKFLERASKFGDILIVGVESDELVIQEKQNSPIISLKDRISALENLKCVDIAIDFNDFNYVSHLIQYNANILILSDNNKDSKEKRFTQAINYLKNIRGKTIYLPYNKEISSTKIKEKIISSQNPQNSWKEIWEKVSSSNLSDIEVNSDALNSDKIIKLAKYVIEKLNIQHNDSVLDFGCGSGTLLNSINSSIPIRIFGIDIAEGMIKRAIKNNKSGIFLINSHIPFRNNIDHIICYGVLHYLPSLLDISNIINEMKLISNNILIMELPDIDKQKEREENRKLLNKHSEPKQLYFNKQYFKNKNFIVFDNEISITNHSDYGFTTIYKNKNESRKSD